MSDVALQQKSVILSVAKAPARQIFDLGGITIVYYVVAVTAIDFDTLTPGNAAPGDANFIGDYIGSIAGTGVTTSRDGVNYSAPLISEIVSLEYFSGGLGVLAEGAIISPRYIAFAPTFFVLDGSLNPVEYTGAQNPTAACTIDIEYI